MKWRVLITCPQLQVTIDQYRPIFLEHDIEIVLPQVEQQLKESQLLDIIEDYDGVIAGDDEFTALVLKKATKLKSLARWGVGIDGVDLDAAKRLGIIVSNTPGVFSNEVADVAMGYIILLSRQLHKLDRSVRDGGWAKIQGASLGGKQLGIIGVGDIGRALAARATASDMQVVGFDVMHAPGSVGPDAQIEFVTLDELLETSDYVSLNCGLTESNRHMIGQREFGLMKRSVNIINTARGPLIDEAALIIALEDGTIGGAALDVFETEPLPADSPLLRFDNCIFGTHNGSNSLEAVLRVNDLAISNLIEGLEAKTKI